MATKLKKYVKFTICCMLIMGLMSPIYAASASVNGDSFITKEEFDKALSDFNKRLNIFEAGINTKIDTQITSYLDRNGIWNAREQVFETDYEATTNNHATIGMKTSLLFDARSIDSHARWVFPNTSSGGINNMGWFGIMSTSPKDQYLNVPDMEYMYASKMVVKNITESGFCMCRLTFGFNIDSTAVRSCAYLAISGSKPDTTNEKWAYMSHFMTQEDRAETKITSPSSSSSDASPDNTYSNLPDDTFGNALFAFPEWTASDADAKYKVYSPPIGTFSFVGFVEKDKPLYYGVAFIGAKSGKISILAEKEHVQNWHMIGADIKVY